MNKIRSAFAIVILTIATTACELGSTYNQQPGYVKPPIEFESVGPVIQSPYSKYNLALMFTSNFAAAHDWSGGVIVKAIQDFFGSRFATVKTATSRQEAKKLGADLIAIIDGRTNYSLTMLIDRASGMISVTFMDVEGNILKKYENRGGNSGLIADTEQALADAFNSFTQWFNADRSLIAKLGGSPVAASTGGSDVQGSALASTTVARTGAQLESERLLKEEEKRKAEGEERSRAKEAKARIAEIARLRQALAERTPAGQAGGDISRLALGGIDFGNYHALVIGINKYKYLPKLKTAAKDARAVAKLLKDDYGFTVKQLINPSRSDILDALDKYREALGPNDNLLIYYAGHGVLDEEVDRGYWQPVEAEQHRRSGWISNATITDTLKGLSAKHVMVVADSCFSGSLVRGSRTKSPKRGDDYWQRMAKKWARVVLTSGGLEPVVDMGGSGHSPFAKAFMDVLRDNASVIDGTTMFNKMRRPVMLAAKQTPEYGDVRQAGHDGGDFIFVRKK
ncbi:MAG: caspase family protein [Proteobacteria bacterium]|nr:caspase family protein [Pseudomonadota bacterium]